MPRSARALAKRVLVALGCMRAGSGLAQAPSPVAEPAPVARWCRVEHGALVGRLLLMDPTVNAYQLAMLQATYDEVLFAVVDTHKWTGKVIYDVGAHIGYHTLNFAVRVGEQGRVYAFEPHELHVRRLRENLEANDDLKQSVEVLRVAVGDRTGQGAFLYSDDLEGGGSSGSCLATAHTPHPRVHYAHHRETQVKVVSIDEVVASGVCLAPDLLKIDVEGAEGLVLRGARDTLRQYEPVVLLEVHGIVAMQETSDVLRGLGYEMELLQEEDRRCFYVARKPDAI